MNKSAILVAVLMLAGCADKVAPDPTKAMASHLNAAYGTCNAESARAVERVSCKQQALESYCASNECPRYAMLKAGLAHQAMLAKQLDAGQITPAQYRDLHRAKVAELRQARGLAARTMDAQRGATNNIAGLAFVPYWGTAF